jgi:hypothetical protein
MSFHFVVGYIFLALLTSRGSGLMPQLMNGARRLRVQSYSSAATAGWSRSQRSHGSAYSDYLVNRASTLLYQISKKSSDGVPSSFLFGFNGRIRTISEGPRLSLALGGLIDGAPDEKSIVAAPEILSTQMQTNATMMRMDDQLLLDSHTPPTDRPTDKKWKFWRNARGLQPLEPWQRKSRTSEEKEDDLNLLIHRVTIVLTVVGSGAFIFLLYRDYQIKMEMIRYCKQGILEFRQGISEFQTTMTRCFVLGIYLGCASDINELVMWVIRPIAHWIIGQFKRG